MPEEQDQVMSDPAISRLTLEQIFKAHGEEGQKQRVYLNEFFLDYFWSETAQDFELFHEDEVSVRIRRRRRARTICAR